MIENASMVDAKDVVVVGGGIVGLCAAFYLREAGRDVTILSREPIGEGASAGNAGMIVPSHLIPLAAPGVVAKGLRWLMNPESPFYVRPRLDLALARWLWTFRRHCTEAHVARAAPILRDLSLASADALDELQRTIGDVGYEQSGLLMVYRTDKSRKENLQHADRAEAAGLSVARLDAPALRRLEPMLRVPAEGAVLYRQDGRVDPDALLRRLAAHLRAGDVVIRDDVAVERLHAQGGRVVRVDTSAGTVRPETVVLAAGAWTPHLARTVGVRVPVQPAKGYSITLPTPAASPRLPAILTDDKITVTPLPGRLRFAGTLALGDFGTSVDARRAAPIRRLADAYRQSEGRASRHAPPVWAGFRPCSPDGLPIVGPSPRHTNLLIATGHGMMGVTLAPITGRLIAALAQDTAPPMDVRPLAPDRFG